MSVPLSIAVPSLLSPMTPNTFSQNYSETPDINLLSDEDLVRRNSLSLRSPPPGSLASDILSTGTENRHYTEAKTILTNLKEMADRFSDFASCQSFSDDTDSSSEKKSVDGFQLQNRKKRNKRNGLKHKLSPSPTKDLPVKKQNRGNSPDSKPSLVV